LSFDKGIDKINPVEIERDFEAVVLERWYKDGCIQILSKSL